ncbi:hypothetical protein IMG5_155110 [Ichthyophthirius multifiliis]|uniref:Transmembrane protein n=1 Tax=Ichthyophthirius multifiliis TaxID=5932 RepID=G0QZ86_ICHMU|nr:hypothetical protein IMG5_155110 [Ichthyophthirius multifiliis]EGR29469.1 hypothetical protein IMG5_155110 [Ichthyophthirius multifiliis]|eukprot:XP_004030705.1 hypothetical protein IMG5_155110 [Ichthyophthirius multifiliis]
MSKFIRRLNYFTIYKFFNFFIQMLLFFHRIVNFISFTRFFTTAACFQFLRIDFFQIFYKLKGLHLVFISSKFFKLFLYIIYIFQTQFFASFIIFYYIFIYQITFVSQFTCLGHFWRGKVKIVHYIQICLLLLFQRDC